VAGHNGLRQAPEIFQGFQQAKGRDLMKMGIFQIQLSPVIDTFSSGTWICGLGAV
jgi:hypothetical protein